MHVRATTFLLFDTFVQLLDGPDPPATKRCGPALIPATGDAHGNTLSFGRAAMVSGHKARDHYEVAARVRGDGAHDAARRESARHGARGPGKTDSQMFGYFKSTWFVFTRACVHACVHSGPEHMC